ncbi:hypothetical protein KC19_VG195600 [Ceratodon purpureus]|uniref:Uncharacterized protein n=1 Tax=Ceratodon purpureus TaxID=3225 RepID=A0A8T0HSB5_CERPU|nr:hypothetical protein KC19_VG195600 [Ceratodon purpureus]
MIQILTLNLFSHLTKQESITLHRTSIPCGLTSPIPRLVTAQISNKAPPLSAQIHMCKLALVCKGLDEKTQLLIFLTYDYIRYAFRSSFVYPYRLVLLRLYKWQIAHFHMHRHAFPCMFLSFSHLCVANHFVIATT